MNELGVGRKGNGLELNGGVHRHSLEIADAQRPGVPVGNLIRLAREAESRNSGSVLGWLGARGWPLPLRCHNGYSHGAGIREDMVP
jgi:hypothetical protein